MVFIGLFWESSGPIAITARQDLLPQIFQAGHVVASVLVCSLEKCSDVSVLTDELALVGILALVVRGPTHRRRRHAAVTQVEKRLNCRGAPVHILKAFTTRPQCSDPATLLKFW